MVRLLQIDFIANGGVLFLDIEWITNEIYIIPRHRYEGIFELEYKAMIRDTNNMRKVQTTLQN